MQIRLEPWLNMLELFSSLVRMLNEKYFLLGLFVKMYDTCTLSDTNISQPHRYPYENVWPDNNLILV